MEGASSDKIKGVYAGTGSGVSGRRDLKIGRFEDWKISSARF
jgi:hypothetical protein